MSKSRYHRTHIIRGETIDLVAKNGIAASNKIIGESLKDNPEYLQWLWIDQIEHANTIYVPTEANLPILEANRLKLKQ